MALRLITLALAVLPLAACDAATDMAGDALGDQVRATFVERCEQLAADNGIEAGMVTGACNCAADNFAEDLQSGELTINRERITEMALTCAGGSASGEQDVAPTEETGG